MQISIWMFGLSCLGLLGTGILIGVASRKPSEREKLLRKHLRARDRIIKDLLEEKH